MTTKYLKMLSLLAVMVIVTAAISVTPYARTSPGEEDPVSAPVRTVEDGETLDAEIDRIGFAIMQLQIQNNQLASSSVSEDVQETIDRNNDAIDGLLAQLDELSPPIPVVEISNNVRIQMESSIDALVESGLPVYSLSIDTSTGNLDILVESSTNIDDQIRSITGDSLPLNIEYGTNTFKLQASSCNTLTGFCDPLIGGSDAEDDHFGLPCTASLAAVRNTWFGTEDGVIIPDHCNPRSSSYCQADNSNLTHLVGSETRGGGSGCDCSFIKSNSRDIDAGKITIGPDDYAIAGKADSAKNKWIFMHGATSGFDHGKIVEVGVSWQDDTTEQWYHNLYKIRYIDFTDGDSGAPAIDIYDMTYAGMNIGAEGEYNYAHEWSYLKSKLGLR